MKNLLRALQNLMCEGKRCKICLVKAENVVNSGAMDKFSNERQTNFRLFNLCNRFCKALLLFLFPLLLFAKPKFSDDQLKAMTPRYFQRNHSAPELMGVSVYKTREGRIYQVEIKVDRNRTNEDLEFAFSALTNMGQYAKKPFNRFIVVLHSDVRDNPPQICIGKAKCSIDCFIHRKVSYEKWYKECIYFKEL